MIFFFEKRNKVTIFTYNLENGQSSRPAEIKKLSKMKTIIIYKNGGYLGTYQYDETSKETLKRFCIRVSNTNVNARYELKISGDFTRTYSNI